MQVNKVQNRAGQSGFTLIEIIAVLVILGILAAVAVPRFVDLQDEAEEKAFQGACAAVSSNVNLQFSKSLLNGQNASEAISNATTSGASWISDLGDFTASAPGDPGTSSDSFTVTVTRDESGNTHNCDIANPAYDGS